MNILNIVKENKIKSLLVVLGALTLFVLIFMYNNKVAPVSWNVYGAVNTKNGIALQGADVVAYHTKSQFKPGDSKFSHKTKEAVWYFASEQNKKLFIAAPEKYMPQYGGYCAFAVSTGVTAVAQSDIWTIQNGKLYVFNNTDVKVKWINEKSSAASDMNWAKR